MLLYPSGQPGRGDSVWGESKCLQYPRGPTGSGLLSTQRYLPPRPRFLSTVLSGNRFFADVLFGRSYHGDVQLWAYHFEFGGPDCRPSAGDFEPPRGGSAGRDVYLEAVTVGELAVRVFENGFRR